MISRRLWGLPLALLLFICLGGEPSAATPNKARARALLKEGNRLRAEGKISEALGRYERARALYPSFRIDYNMGLCLVELGKAPRAATHLGRFLRRGAARSPLEMVQQARKLLAALKGKIATVSLESNVAGATVKIDGHAAGVTPLPGLLYLSPGRHRLEVHKLGYHAELWQDSLAAGGERQVSVSLRAKVTTPRPSAKGSSRTSWGYAALGVAGAFLSAGAVLYAVGYSDGSDAHGRYQDAASTPDQPELVRQSRAEVDAARTKVTVGHVFMGVAAASLGVAIYALVTGPSEVTVAPSPLASGASLQLRGSF